MLTIYSNSSYACSQSTWQRICILARDDFPVPKGTMHYFVRSRRHQSFVTNQNTSPPLLPLTPRESEGLESCCITNQVWWQNIWVSHPKRRRPLGSLFFLFFPYLLWVETRWRVPPWPRRCCRRLRKHGTDLLWRQSWGCCRSRRALRSTNRIRE